MGTQLLLTVEEFKRLPEDGFRHELSEGQLVAMPPPQASYSLIARQVFIQLFMGPEQAGLGKVVTEMAYRLSPGTVRVPDVSFLLHTQLQRIPGEGYFEGAPDLNIAT